MNQEINFIPDFGAATNGIVSRVTWELEGNKPLRCEGVEASGKSFSMVFFAQKVLRNLPGK